jgi:uncharacterized membrane protein HdeD (DUF308 family)
MPVACSPSPSTQEVEQRMLILGVILLLLGLFLKISILWTIGVILLVIGAVLFILGAVGRPVGGRRHYW